MKRRLLFAVAAPLLSLLSAPAFAACDYAATVLENHVKHDGTSLYRCNSSNNWVAVTGLPAAAAGSTGYVQFNTSGALDSDSNLYWDNTNKRLGIGTTSPTQVLDITQSSSAAYASSSASAGFPYTSSDPMIRIRNSNSTLGSAAYIGFSSVSGGSTHAFTYIASFAEDSGSSSGAIAFGSRTGATSYSEYMRIDSSGNLGIGTASPTTAIDVRTDDANNSSLVNVATFYHSTSGTAAAGIGTGLLLGTERADGAVGIAAGVYGLYTGVGTGSGTNGALAFYTTTTSTSFTEKMRIDKDGNLGIGTTVPGRLLSVYGASPYIGLTDTASTYEDTISNVSGALHFNTGGGNSMIFQLGGSEKMRIMRTSGNVGIGTSSPNATLDVYGTFLARSGSSPTINSCGTSPTISGTNNSMVLTMGSGTLTTCSVTFSPTWTTAPKACVFAPANATAAAQGTTAAYISAISTTTLTFTGSNLTSAKYYIHCM